LVHVQCSTTLTLVDIFNSLLFRVLGAVSGLLPHRFRESSRPAVVRRALLGGAVGRTAFVSVIAAGIARGNTGKGATNRRPVHLPPKCVQCDFRAGRTAAQSRAGQSPCAVLLLCGVRGGWRSLRPAPTPQGPLLEPLAPPMSSNLSATQLAPAPQIRRACNGPGIPAAVVRHRGHLQRSWLRTAASARRAERHCGCLLFVLLLPRLCASVCPSVAAACCLLTSTGICWVSFLGGFG
jgi:hypothetical protein